MSVTLEELPNGEVKLTIVGVKGDNGNDGAPGVAGPVGPAGMGSSIPGGRLTLASGYPEMLQASDYSSTALYYTPFESNQIPLFDGTAFASHQFTSGDIDSSGLFMVGGTKWAANKQYDVFGILVDGVPRLCTGPAWPSDTLPSRGLIRHSGKRVNAGQIICDISETETVTVPIYQATWIGSINIGPEAGVLKATFTLGQNRRCDVWNAYHQKEILLGVAQPAVPPPAITWKMGNNHPNFQPFNNDLNNSGYYFTGLPQNVEVQYIQRGFLDAYNFGICAILVAVCKNTISNVKGTIGSFSSDIANVAVGASVEATFNDKGSIGSQRVFMCACNANETGPIGVSMWSLSDLAGRAPEEAHVMWIKYLG